MKIILASQSGARRRALDIVGLDYDVVSSDIDEKAIRDANPIELVRRLSEAKAKDVGGKNKGCLIIGGDLVVYFDGKVYEKPSTFLDAYKILKSFSGNWVSIIGGVAVYNSDNGKVNSAVDEYRVKFRDLSDSEIRDYVKRYPVLRCAGGFEGDGLFKFAEKAEGDYPFISQITFPMNKLIEFLREEGVDV